MRVAHPIIVAFRVPARVVPLAILLGACVSPQVGSGDRAMNAALAGHTTEPLALVERASPDALAPDAFLNREPFSARIAPAPLPSAPPELPIPNAWRLRLTRL